MKMLASSRPLGAATIVHSVAPRNSSICNICTLASFVRSAPPKYVVIVDALGVFGCCVHFYIMCQFVMRIWLCDLAFSIGTQTNNHYRQPNASDTLRSGLGKSEFQLVHGGGGRHSIVRQSTIVGLFDDLSWARLNVPVG